MNRRAMMTTGAPSSDETMRGFAVGCIPAVTTPININ
jgi:hypothetical protein